MTKFLIDNGADESALDHVNTPIHLNCPSTLHVINFTEAENCSLLQNPNLRARLEASTCNSRVS